MGGVGGICLKDRGINNKSLSSLHPRYIYIYKNVMFGSERVPCARVVRWVSLRVRKILGDK